MGDIVKSGGGPCSILRALGVYWASVLASWFLWSSEGVLGAVLGLLEASGGWAPWVAVGRHSAAPRRPRSNFPNVVPPPSFYQFW